MGPGLRLLGLHSPKPAFPAPSSLSATKQSPSLLRVSKEASQRPYSLLITGRHLKGINFLFEGHSVRFETAVIPFPCNGILLIQGNLPRVIFVFTLNYSSFLIPYFNLLFSFIENGLALSSIIF